MRNEEVIFIIDELGGEYFLVIFLLILSFLQLVIILVNSRTEEKVLC
jgi:hypothetical protein